VVKCRQEQQAWRLEREVCSRRCEGIDFCEFRAQVTATTTRTLPRSCCGRSWSSSTAGLQTHLHAHARARAHARTRTRADTRAGSHTCTIARKRSFAHCRHKAPRSNTRRGHREANLWAAPGRFTSPMEIAALFGDDGEEVLRFLHRRWQVRAQGAAQWAIAADTGSGRRLSDLEPEL
jgi:hypothetical protein